MVRLFFGKILISVLCSFCLLINFSSQASAVLTPLNDDTEFVKQVYFDFLNREADASGLAYWSGEIDSGRITRAQLVESYINSVEFGQKVSPVTRLYFAYFNRIPDYSGLMYWVGQYRSGAKLVQISNSFASSGEFVTTYGSLSNSAFVSLVYQNVLGRDPDTSGLAYWTDELDSGRTTRGQVMIGFSESAENKALMQNKIYVTMTYIGLLRRSPDQGGFDYWVARMDGGDSGLGLINDFLISAEYAGRFDTSRNIILIIGDGMGFEQVRAAGMFANGNAGSLFFESLPIQGAVKTSTISGVTTDSAAAGTAMATGFKVDNGVISQYIPGDGLDLETILEKAKRLGASTGLVTTTTISHATPATFGAHEPNRENYPEIILDYLTGSRPNVLFGGARYIDPTTAMTAGYTVVENHAELVSMDTDIENMVWGQFGKAQMPYEFDTLGILPHLSESTQVALNMLDNDPDGFFLVVEGGLIDYAGHSNDIQRNIFETIELSNTVQIVSNWASSRDDTLIIVTADHETGGLQILSNNGQGNFPDVTWSTTGHTNQDVPIYAWGVNANLINGTIENVDIFSVMDATLSGD